MSLEINWATVGDEQRAIHFRPAFHRCDPNPSKNYGISSVHMTWLLRVDDWAVSWDVFTDWGMSDEAFKAASPDCVHPMHQKGYPRHKAHGGAVDWHSPIPLYEDQEPSQERCDINGAACYLDSGFILGEIVFDVLRDQGDEATWKRLRELLDERRSATNPQATVTTPENVETSSEL